MFIRQQRIFTVLGSTFIVLCLTGPTSFVAKGSEHSLSILIRQVIFSELLLTNSVVSRPWTDRPPSFSSFFLTYITKMHLTSVRISFTYSRTDTKQKRRKTRTESINLPPTKPYETHNFSDLVLTKNSLERHVFAYLHTHTQNKYLPKYDK